MKLDLALIRADGFEAQYVGYQRVQNIQGLLKYDGGALVNTSPIEFPECGDVEELCYFVVFCDGLPWTCGELSMPLHLRRRIRPAFAPGALQIETGPFNPPATFKSPLRVNRQIARISHEPLQDAEFSA